MDFLLTSASFWQTVVSQQPRPNSVAPRIQVEQKFDPWVHQQRQIARQNRDFWAQRVEKISPPKSMSTSANVENFSQRVVVIAPHPDDEILCCSRTLADKIADGAEVSIIFLTDGDARERGAWQESRAYGTQRRAESIAAVRQLGVSRKNLYFLGFPDGYLDKLLADGQARSEYTGRRVTSRSAAVPGTPYTEAGIERVLKKILKNLQPDEIFVPSTMDTHPDHAAAAKIVQRSLVGTPEMHAYLVHGETGTPDTEQNLEKLRLIRLFRSQRNNRAAIQFLEKFASIRERFEQVLVRR